VLLAIATTLVIAAAMALLMWGFSPATSGVGAQDANPNAGAAIVHDDAANMPPGAGAAVVHDDAANVNPR
jgi:hypothetical protein